MSRIYTIDVEKTYGGSSNTKPHSNSYTIQGPDDIYSPSIDAAVASFVAFERGNALTGVFFGTATVRTALPFDSDETPDTVRVIVLTGNGTNPENPANDPDNHLLPAESCLLVKMSGGGRNSPMLWYRHSINADCWERSGGQVRLIPAQVTAVNAAIDTLEQAIRDNLSVTWLIGGKNARIEREVRDAVCKGIGNRQLSQKKKPKKSFTAGKQKDWDEVLQQGGTIAQALAATVASRYTGPVGALLALPTTLGGLKQLETAVQEALDVVQTKDYGPDKLAQAPAGGN